MPQHGHTAVASTVGNHKHTMSRGANVSDTTALADYHNTGHYLLDGGTTSGKTSANGQNTPNVIISEVGNNAKHENRMPYNVVYRWHRTA